MINKKAAGVLATGAMTLLSTMTAFSMIKTIEINADLDNVPTHEAGECFYPEYEVDEEDENGLTVTFSEPITASTDNPTVPATVKVYIASDEENLDDDLRITGTGIRSTYVDMVSVDNSEASARLQVYPFYILKAPDLTLNTAAGTLSWDPVPYAAKYEVLVNYARKNADDEVIHRTTKETSFNISNYLKSAYNGELGIAVRALPTDVNAQSFDIDGSNPIVNWGSFAGMGVNNYKVVVSYTNTQGNKQKKSFLTQNTYYDCTAYTNSAKDGKVHVEVKAQPTTNETRYYNIAVSDWAQATNKTVDTSDYEEDRWDFLSDYQSAVDGSFATNTKPANAYMAGLSTNAIGSGDADAYWNRVTYKWQYVISGVPFNQGWKKINGYWYYFDADGFMHTGWLQWNGKWYYLESKVGATCGIMYQNMTALVYGQSYTFGADGACVNK